MSLVKFEGKTFEKFILSEEIKSITNRLAQDINTYYKDFKEDLVFISILDGAFIFMADLVRLITIDIEIEFVKLKSYEGTSSRGEVAHLLKLQKSIEGKHILVIEDIIDTGLTIEIFLEELAKKKPASVKICSLLSKPDVHNDIVTIDFIGKEIEPEFVIGYGLDINGKARNLADIYKLKV